MPSRRKKSTLLKFITDSIEILLAAFLIFVVLNIFLGQLLIVTGDSMYPTLKDGEQIVGEKVSLSINEPSRGDIFIFRHPKDNKLLIKRVIALPGETVQIKDGKVFVEGTDLRENYTQEETHPGKYLTEGRKETVPENHFLMLGDNRTKSMDGRDWGFIPRENLESKALLVYYPWGNFRIIRK